MYGKHMYESVEWCWWKRACLAEVRESLQALGVYPKATKPKSHLGCLSASLMRPMQWAASGDGKGTEELCGVQ